jgi:hypothetical protein
MMRTKRFPALSRGRKSPRSNFEYLVMVITISYIAIGSILYIAVDFHIRLIANGLQPPLDVLSPRKNLGTDRDVKLCVSFFSYIREYCSFIYT